MELILREEAIKCLDGNVLITEQKEAEAVKEYFKMVISRLKALPTIEERKEGEWNFIGWNQFECTCCGYPYTQEQLRAVTTRNDQIFPHFCPNCGARMK